MYDHTYERLSPPLSTCILRDDLIHSSGVARPVKRRAEKSSININHAENRRLIPQTWRQRVGSSFAVNKRKWLLYNGASSCSSSSSSSFSSSSSSYYCSSSFLFTCLRGGKAYLYLLSPPYYFYTGCRCSRSSHIFTFTLHKLDWTIFPSFLQGLHSTKNEPSSSSSSSTRDSSVAHRS